MNEKVKHRRKQYKRDIDICGSPDMGYVHGETIGPSFTLYIKMKE